MRVNAARRHAAAHECSYTSLAYVFSMSDQQGRLTLFEELHQRTQRRHRAPNVEKPPGRDLALKEWTVHCAIHQERLDLLHAQVRFHR